MAYVIVRDGIIENVVEWDGDTTKWQPPEGTEAHEWTGRANPGWAWQDGAPVEPPPPPRDLADVKREKLAAVATELARRNSAGFTYQGKGYQLDEASQGRIDALATKAERVVSGRQNATWDGRFIAADNTETTFTAEEFGAFADAASNVVIARRFHARDLKNQILAAASLEDLAAIDTAAGWE